MIIKKADKSHIMQISELWNEAFGDAESDVLEYLEYLLQFFYVCVASVKAASLCEGAVIRVKGGNHIGSENENVGSHRTHSASHSAYALFNTVDLRSRHEHFFTNI